jgi:hypothetical protein
MRRKCHNCGRQYDHPRRPICADCHRDDNLFSHYMRQAMDPDQGIAWLENRIHRMHEMIAIAEHCLADARYVYHLQK